MIKTDLINQYAHTWRVFERVVNDFEADAWLHTGRKTITPARLSFHILKATQYYLQDTTPILFESGKSFEINSETAQEADLPSQKDIVTCIHEFKIKTENWLSETDLNTANLAFKWAGETQFGVALFLLRHSLYHLGELSSLLNESKHGDAEDNYVKAL